jgi:acylaminoacyl-peptidase
MNTFSTRLACVVLLLATAAQARAAEPTTNRFRLQDVFALEFASDPQISPDGKRVVYVRHFMDIMKDQPRSNLWIINTDGSGHRPLTSGDRNDSAPRWSPDGKRLLYISRTGSGAQIFCRWLDTGQTAQLTRLTSAPVSPVWSPDGSLIAFAMHVVETPRPFVELPARPKGAEWAEPPKVIRNLSYRHDGKGYLKDGFFHLFVVPAEGGAARQVTSGPFHHAGQFGADAPVWSSDGKSLIVSANRHPEWELDPLNSEIYEVTIADGAIKQLTRRQGPDGSPALSPDGKQIAYVGFDDKRQGYQVKQLYMMNRDGSGSHALLGELDRDIQHPVWSKDGKGLFFQYDDLGISKIGYLSLEAAETKVQVLAANVGGTTIDRPYASGSFSVAENGSVAFTLTGPEHPADVAFFFKNSEPARRLTSLNQGLLGHKQLATVEEIRYKSSHDGRKIQGWIMKPPGFDAKKQYPLILEIHGGPFANYGPRFSAEMQLYAAAGYVVFYGNPRGSTSYGREFGNLIHHDYPGNDYDDLMSGVDAVLARGYVDPKNLFVTGGSGGGVLSAWIIGKTGRFRAAVVCKPVINWYSFVLTADLYSFFTRNWFPGYPWEHPEHYHKRSPISLAGNVTTPTMILTGEEDHRTPMSESEQLYQALKLRQVDSVLVRIPGASHDIAARPSRMMVKAACVLKWFESHRGK